MKTPDQKPRAGLLTAFLFLFLMAPQAFSQGPNAPADDVFLPLQITAQTDPLVSMAVSADGRHIVYTTGSHTVSDLWMASADPEVFELPEKLLPATSGRRSPAISRSGDQIAYVDTGFDAKGDIYLLHPKNPDTSPIRLTGRETADEAPVFSPDGRHLFFHTARSNQAPHLAVLDLSKAGEEAEALTIDTGGDAAYPALSPDGKTLAFVSTRNNPGGNIYTCRLVENQQCTEIKQVTDGPAIDRFPAWGPDGRTLYFSRTASDTDGDGKLTEADKAVICRISDAGRQPPDPATPLTLLRHYAAQPQVTQKRLYYLSDRAGVANCWALPAAGRIREMETAAKQLGLARRIAGRIPDVPYLSLLAWYQVMERFPDSAAAAKAGLSAGRGYEALNLEGSARHMYARVARDYADVGPEAPVAGIRERELKGRRQMREAATSSRRAKVLDATIAAIERISSREASPAVQAEAAFAKTRLMLAGQKAAGNMLTLLNWLDPVIQSDGAGPSNKARALYFKSRVYDAAGLGQNAEATCRRLLQDFPEERPWTDRAVSRLIDGAIAELPASAPEAQPKQQIDLLQRLAEKNRETLPELALAATNRIGDIHYAQDQWESAKSAYRRVMESNPELTPRTAAARFSLAEILYREERFRQALDLYETALEKEQIKQAPGTDRIYQLARNGYIRKTTAAGEFHYRLGELPAAKNAFRELIDYDETIVAAHRGYLKCAAAAGDIEKAIADYEKKLKTHPNSALWLYTAGLALSYRNTEPALEAAGKRIRKAIRLNGHVEYFHQTLGFIHEMLETVYNKKKQLEPALEAYKKAYFLNDPEANPENAANLELNLGNTFYLLGQYGKAFEFYDRRVQRETPFAEPRTEIVFYKRLGECAFQARNTRRAKSAYETSLEKIDARMAPLAPAKGFDRLHRLVRDRVIAPALKLPDLESRARELAGKQSEISAAVSKLAEKAGPPPGQDWTAYKKGIERLLEQQEALNRRAAELAREVNRACAAGRCRAYMESPEETFQLMTANNIRNALSFPEALLVLKTEMTDRLGLACQELQEWEEAIAAFKQVFALNRQQGETQNLARNRRAVAYNTYHLARSRTGEKGRRLLETAADEFRRVLELIDAHGTAPPEKREKQALIDISFQTALDAASATEAARGFSEVQERRLAQAFLSRISLELGELETARENLEEQLAQYPPDAAVDAADRYGVALLYHRAGLLAHAMGASDTAWRRFAYSAELCLQMQSPVSAAMNMTNLAAVLERGLAAGALPESLAPALERFQKLEPKVRRLLESAPATSGSMRRARYHNQMGVCYSLMAGQTGLLPDLPDTAAGRAVYRISLLARAAGHLNSGIAVCSENEWRPAREALEIKARLHLNLAAVARMSREPQAAREHFEKAQTASEKGFLPDLRWRALAGQGRLEEALAELSGLTIARADCLPMEITRSFGPLVQEKLNEKGAEAAFHLAEQIAELERFNRTAESIRPDRKAQIRFYTTRHPRLRRIAALQEELAGADAADAEDSSRVQDRLAREIALLEQSAADLPEPVARIGKPETRRQVMRAFGAAFLAEEAAGNLAGAASGDASGDAKQAYENLIADYHAASRALEASGSPEAAVFRAFFRPDPAGVMDVLESLEPGQRLLRIFPTGGAQREYVVFILSEDGIEAETIPSLNAVTSLLKGLDTGPAPYIAYEDPTSLRLEQAFPQVYNASHLYRSYKNRKPFKNRLMVLSESMTLPGLAESFTALPFKSREAGPHPEAAYALGAANTLVLPHRLGGSASVPTGAGETAAPFMAADTGSSRPLPLSGLLSRTSNLSLALVAKPESLAMDRMAHLFALYGCPSLVTARPDGALEKDQVETLLKTYSEMNAFDATAETTPPSKLLFLGYQGLGPAAATELARQSFAGYVEDGRSAFDAGNYETALIHFDNAATIAGEIEQFSRYLPALYQYARESAYQAGNLENALSYAQKLADILEMRQPDSKAHAEAMLTLGLIHSRLSRYDQAVPVIETAVEMFAMLEADGKMARAMTDLGIVLENATNYESALSRFQSAADLSREIDDRQMLAAQHSNIGRIYDLRLNRYPEAIQHYTAALELYREMGEPEKIAESRLNIGRCHRLLGVFPKAADCYEKALKTLDKLEGQTGGPARLRAKIIIEQANNAWFQGEFETAFRLQRECAKLAAQNDLPLLRVISQNTAGLIWWSLGNYEKALTELENGLKMARDLSIREDEVASTLNNIGLVHREMGDYEKALQRFDQALEIDGRLMSQWAMAYDYRNKGLTYLKMNQPDNALPLFERAITLSGAIGNQINTAKALLGKGHALLALNEFEKAKTAYAEALELSRGMRIKETWWRALFGMGKISRDFENQPEQAGRYLREAIEIIESMRSAISIKALKENFMVDRLAVYEALVELLADQEKPRAAFEIAERSRSRNFIDLLGAQRVSLAGGRESALYDRQAAIRSEIEATEQLLAAAGTEAEKAAYQDALDELENQWDNLMIDIQANHPRLSTLISIPPVDTETIINRLEPGVALLSYYVLDEEMLCWVLKHQNDPDAPTNIRLIRTPADKNELSERVLGYRRLIQNLEPYEAHAEDLHERLIAPVRQELDGVHTLGIIPHGSLHYLSYATLYDGERFLVDDFSLFYLPSTSVLDYTLARRIKRPKLSLEVLAIGNPDLDNPALELPFAEPEVDSIHWNFPEITVLTRGKATEQWVVDNIGRFDIIHIASHGEFDPVNPLMSAIKLSPAEKADGDLLAAEVFGLDIKADMVCLSACQTGLGKVEAGDEIIGLNRSFFYAGTHTVISSLWRVSDVSTAMLIKTFYRRYTAANKADSLREAARHVRQRYPHPGYWGAFTLVGDFK